MRKSSALPDLGPIIHRPTLWLRVAVYGAATSLFAWLVFYPQPYYVSILAGVIFVLTLAVGAAAFPDWLRLENSLPAKDPNRVHVLESMLVVSLALAMRAFVDHEVTVAPPLLMWVGLVSGALSLALWIAVKRAKFWKSVLVGTALSTGVVIQANGLAESEPPQVNRGVVARKYTSTKPIARTIVVRTKYREIHVRVSRAAFETYAPMQEVCVVWRYGVLGIETRALEQCKDGA